MNDNENTNQNTAEDVEVDGAGVGTQANENKDEGKAGKEAKTYTQEDINALDKKLKAKYEKKYKDIDIDEYKKWKESQKTVEQKNAEKETAYQKALSDLKDKDNYIAVLESGVSKDDSDYVLFKVSRMEGDFEENLEEFLKNNPKFLKTEKAEAKTTGTSVNATANSNISGVNAILKQKHPDLF